MQVVMLAFTLMVLIGIYLASLVQHAGAIIATEQMTVILGAGILAAVAGFLLTFLA